jgi:hypothetical protein
MAYSLRYRILQSIARNPFLFKSWYGVRLNYRELMVSFKTELVIEGYPRCANSFAVIAFEQSQKRHITIAHHLHAESQITFGVKYGIPILILIRDPLGAVTSLVTRDPEIGITQALRRYLQFYRTVSHFSESLLVADFNDVTTHYGLVIQCLNEKFDTDFGLYENKPERDAVLFTILDDLNSKDANGKINMVARPSARKTKLLNANRKDVSSHPLLLEAKVLYTSILDGFLSYSTNS